MAEFPAGQERLLRQLFSTFRCPVCRRAFEGNHVRLAARQDDILIVSVRCRRCRNQQIYWVALEQRTEEGVLRDTTDLEEAEFAARDPVSSDDVLDMHEFLREFTGDFRDLFRR